MKIHKDHTASSRITNSLEKNEDEKIIKVNMIDAKTLIKKSDIKKIDLIKIDVEGHEEIVLKNFKSLISKYKPRAIVFEHSKKTFSENIKNLFKELNYSILGIKKSLLNWKLIPLKKTIKLKNIHNDYVAIRLKQ